MYLMTFWNQDISDSPGLHITDFGIIHTLVFSRLTTILLFFVCEMKALYI